MDSQALGIVATIVINSVAIAWTIRETFVRHGQTKELQESNARLQNEVHRLSVHLNQEIVRLNRLNDLTTDLYRRIARENYRFGILFPGQRKGKTGGIATDSLINELSDCLSVLEGSIAEMKAIAKVIGDAELLSLIDEFRLGVPNFDTDESMEQWLNRQNEFGRRATAVHEKVYKLLQAATEAA
ncbi:MAG: hypothetical protein F4X02_00755 [Chloroflexi bacterium]|nr:hypothetical protein [Chloroflexota bacterium]